MPLSPPAPRKRVHTRTIECVGYERKDGLWDIEGHLTDVKTQLFMRPETGEVVKPGTATHDMWMRFTINISFTIHLVEVVMDAYRCPICVEILPNFQKLIGLTIGRGFKNVVKNLVGDIHGCTHLSELIGRMATTAYQATNKARGEREGFNSENRGRRLINTCRTYASDSQIVQECFPNLYTGSRTQSRS
jgi:hypothetical protein